ncbi:MAG: PfkB family carbohydrate kinase [Erysipelotrichaceae bacterium]
MSKVLVIGSTVIDVVLNVEALPTSGSDVHVYSQEMMLGGCAYNVHRGLSYHHIDHTLYSPIGKGVFAEKVNYELSKEGITLSLQSDEDNGCCYCLIEPSGERSFICHRGAEYRFKKEWFDTLNMEEYDTVYLCGLELEEKTAIHLVDFVCAHPSLSVYFAPGPRVNKIEKDLLNRLLNRGVIVHMNEEELINLTQETNLNKALSKLYKQTNQKIITSLGDKGAILFDGEKMYQAFVSKVKVENTNGAGDAHIAGMIAAKQLKMDNLQALEFANNYASKVVMVKESYLK